MAECYSGASPHKYQEEDVKKAIILAIGGIALLAGCGSQSKTTANAPAEPKWKGLPYRISLDAKDTKPGAAGVALPDFDIERL